MSAKRDELARPVERYSEAPLHLIDELHGIVRRADVQNPSRADRAALKKFFDDHPGLLEWLPAASTLPERVLIEKLSPLWATAEIIRRENQALRDELGYESASMIERLMIDRIVVCKLRLAYVENYSAEAMSPGHSLKESDYADKLLTRAHRRYESAMESLARLRKLNLPKKANQPGALALLKARD
jgi:hypothetical protein